DKIAWYENDGEENFAERVINTSADVAFSVFAADVDGDGDLDVLSAFSDGDTIAWYENDGDENFTEHVISTSAQSARSVFAADVDGDGDLDVLSASQDDDTIAWYENDGDENFTERVISTTNGASSVFAADVDGDSDLDVLSASFWDNKIAWYENDGDENFIERVISTSANNAISVFAADVDQDGDLDVLSASFSDDKIAWYENRIDTPPSALASAPDINAFTSDAQTIIVTYSDDFAIDASTIGAGDIEVIPPLGPTFLPTYVSQSTMNNVPQITATYTLLGPGGNWDTSDNGTYQIVMRSNEVFDIAGHPVSQGVIGNFVVSIDDLDPMATATAPNVTSISAASQSISVTYTDNVAIDASTIGANDINIQLPDSSVVTASYLSSSSTTNTSPITATYELAAPGGFWDANDNGTYTILMVVNEVLDSAGNAVPPGPIGSFVSNITGTVAPGDFDLDGDVDGDDIDLLCLAIQAGDQSSQFDMDGNGIVNATDFAFLLDLMGTKLGDADLDGFVDGRDFIIWNENRFQFNDPSLPGVGWATADFNCDG
ncbi:unnamed protein product, partial [marine sediment metagenome]